jgi:hypothetical protein
VQVGIRRQHVAAGHHVMTAGHVADVSARLADEEEPGGDVPGRGGNRSSCPFADLCMVTLIATAAITDFGRI